MSKKKHAAEHVNLERWLVSYADFITLLFAFFVVMFSASQVDRSKTKKMALAIESAFERFSIFKTQSGDSPDEESMGGSGGNAKHYREILVQTEEGATLIVPPSVEQVGNETLEPPKGDEALDANTGFISSEEKALARAKRSLEDLLNAKKINGEIKIGLDERGVIVSLKEAVLFEAGANVLAPGSDEILKSIADIVSGLKNQVRIEGHTDNEKPGALYASNWALSTDRAVHIVEHLLSVKAMDPSRFIAVGYGEYRPAYDNATEDGRKSNRRVDLVILTDEVASKEAPVPLEAKSVAAPLPKVPRFEDEVRRKTPSKIPVASPGRP